MGSKGLQTLLTNTPSSSIYAWNTSSFSLPAQVAAATFAAVPFLAEVRPLNIVKALADTSTNSQEIDLIQIFEDVPLKPFWATFHPFNLLKIFGKHSLIYGLLKINVYLIELLEIEKQILESEEKGIMPPELPPFPNLIPCLHLGLKGFVRELLIVTCRSIYERIACLRIPPKRMRALVRDHRAWIRDVLALRMKNDPPLKRFISYACATLHATILLHAADCTISIGYHTYNCIKQARQKDKSPPVTLSYTVLYWLKGSALQVIRCSVVLVAVSAGASLGSLIKPGQGTLAGQLAAELAASQLMHNVIIVLLK